MENNAALSKRRFFASIVNGRYRHTQTQTQIQTQTHTHTQREREKDLVNPIRNHSCHFQIKKTWNYQQTYQENWEHKRKWLYVIQILPLYQFYPKIIYISFFSFCSAEDKTQGLTNMLGKHSTTWASNTAQFIAQYINLIKWYFIQPTSWSWERAKLLLGTLKASVQMKLRKTHL
jgi:hypothetical protein